LWTDRLYVSLEPESLAACRVRGFFVSKVISKTREEFDAQYGPAQWDGAVEALKKRLHALKAERLRVTVVLSNRLVRYALVPFDAALSGPDEELALARFHFTRIYGERAKSWDLRLSAAAPGRPRIASGVDEGLVKAIGTCFPVGGRPRLVSVQPYLMAAFNQWRRGIAGDSAWLVLLERSRACFALASRGGWQSVQSLRLQDPQEVFELLEREALRAGGKPSRTAMIFGGRPAAGAGWQVGYAPADDAHYAMALSAL
jgi:hypothetical protein